jgi:hypothetical protein
MDKEFIFYIVEYFSHLLSDDEQHAIRYAYFIINNEEGDEESEVVTVTNNILRRHRLIQSNQTVLDYIRTGLDSFNTGIANHLMEEYKDRIFLNLCPQCRKLARTPYARQCRHCGYDWHEKVIGEFEIEQVLKISTREDTFLLGKIIKGNVIVGNYIDLQLEYMPQIRVIEYVRRGAREYLALGVNITERQKAFLEKTVVNQSVHILED